MSQTFESGSNLPKPMPAPLSCQMTDSMAPPASANPAAATEFLSGGGQMGELMRSHDWTQSPLGAPQGWPEPLKMAVSICLNSRFPMVLWWGPDFIMLYNDAWRPVLGATISGPARSRRRTDLQAFHLYPTGEQTEPDIPARIRPPRRRQLNWPARLIKSSNFASRERAVPYGDLRKRPREGKAPPILRISSAHLEPLPAADRRGVAGVKAGTRRHRGRRLSRLCSQLNCCSGPDG